MQAARYIWERRLADPLWTARWRRSLGRNRGHRKVLRRRKELAKAFAQGLFARDAQLKKPVLPPKLGLFHRVAANIGRAFRSVRGR